MPCIPEKKRLVYRKANTSFARKGGNLNAYKGEKGEGTAFKIV